MGIVEKTIRVVTCDVCGQSCGEQESEISIQVNGGDGRDVGPAHIYGTLRFNQPYGCIKGIVCKACKREWLKRYVMELERDES